MWHSCRLQWLLFEYGQALLGEGEPGKKASWFCPVPHFAVLLCLHWEPGTGN